MNETLNHDGLAKWSGNIQKISDRIQILSQIFIDQTKQAHQQQHGRGQKMEFALPQSLPDPLHISQGFLQLQQALLKNPSDLYQKQVSLWGEFTNLWQQSALRFMGMEHKPIITPEKGDKRFKDDVWSENILFDFIKQSYLLAAKTTQDLVEDASDLDDKTHKKMDFFTRQFVDALAPTNFLATNPTVLQETMNSQGENLVHGLDNLIHDLKQSQGQDFKISMTDNSAFELGKNIASTKGAVIYKNELMELIQYSPTTKQVHPYPLLIIPPWINKFYILDLQPKNSFIHHMVNQGHSVFCISWVNPDESLRHMGFDDYMRLGPLAALEVMGKLTGEKKSNVIGYCLGGTLLAAMLAMMSKKRDNRVHSASFFTTMVDFAEPGELGVFIDEAQLQSIEEKMAEKGYLEGSSMANSFNMLRANDLIWSFVVNNYLLGKQPFPFDLLYWNGDSTRMPEKMHRYYLRNFYQNNLLVCKNALTMLDTQIDLSRIKTPCFILSTREDHIAPWKSTYRATQIYKGSIKFVLAGSGHIAGVINPPIPDKPKYGYWMNDVLPASPDEWLENADQHEGSWWPEYTAWLSQGAAPKKPALPLGSKEFPPQSLAPGTYVNIRA